LHLLVKIHIFMPESLRLNDGDQPDSDPRLQP
jgi:hypothetical protein